MMAKKYVGAMIAIFMALGTAAYGQSDHLKVGKTGHLTLTQEAAVGNAVLPPGDYEVRHRRSASDHFVEFIRVAKNHTRQEGLSSNDEDVANVPCTMRSLNAPVARTYAEISKGRLAHVNSLRIRGENVVHLFEAGPDPSATQNQIEYGGPGM